MSNGTVFYERTRPISNIFHYPFLSVFRFIFQVIDSDDLPLNVNRETLQESKIIKIIKKKLVRKVVEMIRKLALDSEKKSDDSETKEAEIDADGNVIEVEDDEEDDEPNKYIQWYKKFAPSLKMGVIEDDANRGKLSKLLRYHSSKTDGEDDFVSLEQYVGRMKDWQDEIYFFAGQSEEEMESSHFMDKFKEKDVEVLFFTDPIDEYMVQNLRDCRLSLTFVLPLNFLSTHSFVYLAYSTNPLPFLVTHYAHIPLPQSTASALQPSPRRVSNSRTKMKTSSSAERSTTRRSSSLSPSG